MEWLESRRVKTRADAGDRGRSSSPASHASCHVGTWRCRCASRARLRGRRRSRWHRRAARHDEHRHAFAIRGGRHPVRAQREGAVSHAYARVGVHASGLHCRRTAKRAIRSPAVHQVAANGTKTSFAFIVMRPFGEKRGEALQGYRLGRWPSERWMMGRKYWNPDGFIEVTPANAGLATVRALRARGVPDARPARRVAEVRGAAGAVDRQARARARGPRGAWRADAIALGS